MKSRLRRYPALVWLVVAGMLALLLPSGLVTPQSRPSTLAEYAPVPGDSAGASDLGELANSSSEGIGAGGSSARGGATTTVPEAGPNRGKAVRKPGTKRCVGNPPRQTEDPLSPACIAFFEGDNGGATARGVTGEEIRVVVYGFLSTNTVGRGPRDWNTPPASGDTAADSAGKAMVRFFNDRYQTYGRTLRVWGYYSPDGNPEVWTSDMARIREQLDPFAVVTARDGTAASAQYAVREGFLTVAYDAFSRSEYARFAPLLLSWTPDVEDQAAVAGRYVCTRLAGGKARHSKDPDIASRARKFRIAYTSDVRQPLLEPYRAALRNRLAECGIPLGPDVALPNGAQNHAQAVAAMRTDNVTTVLLLTTGGSSAVFSQQASAQAWFPELVTLGSGAVDRGNDRNPSARTHAQSTWDRAFGITFDYRRGLIEEQPWFNAVREGCPSCPEPRDVTYVRMYDALSLLAYAIQAAGPKLSPATVDRGMHAIKQVRSDDPFRPAAYFNPGNYSFIKDAAEIWWDPAGQAPSGAAPGCYRLVDGGRRSRAEDWAGGDGSLFDVSGAPCQGDEYRATTT